MVSSLSVIPISVLRYLVVKRTRISVASIAMTIGMNTVLVVIIWLVMIIYMVFMITIMMLMMIIAFVMMVITMMITYHQ